MSKPIFESVRINLNSPDGNALAIIGIVMNCLTQAKYHIAERESIKKDMLSSDYKHLCKVASKYVYLYEN